MARRVVPNKITRHSASVALELLENGVLCCAVAGPITSATLLHFRAQTLARYAGSFSAMVVDYRRASVAMDGGTLTALGAAADALPMPLAFVVTDADVDMFMEHAARMALRRMSRRVFTESAAAVLWASQANLRAAE